MTRKPPPPPPPAYWTVPELAGLLRQSARQVRRAIARGELVASRFGRSVRVADEDLRRYLAAAGKADTGRPRLSFPVKYLDRLREYT